MLTEGQEQSQGSIVYERDQIQTSRSYQEWNKAQQWQMSKKGELVASGLRKL